MCLVVKWENNLIFLNFFLKNKNVIVMFSRLLCDSYGNVDILEIITHFMLSLLFILKLILICT